MQSGGFRMFRFGSYYCCQKGGGEDPILLYFCADPEARGGGIRQLTVLHFCREKLNRTVNYQRRLISAAAALFFLSAFRHFRIENKVIISRFPFRQISYDFCKKFAQILIHFHVS